MYSIVVKTTNSDTEFGAQISSTKRLHEFLSSMDFQLVTKLEVRYYRELKSPHDVSNLSGPVSVDTGSITAIVSNGPDSWEVHHGRLVSVKP